jgi:DNA-binding GntR family transcriptional regulator
MPVATMPARSLQAAPALKQVEKTTLREQVTQSVRSALMNGHFQPGQVVTVKSIAQMVGASVMPAREAMNRLIAEGALELRANRTVIVPVLSRHEFDELTDLRCHIEGLAATQAVAHALPTHLARLRQIDKAMRAASRRGDADAYLDGNVQFHFVIYNLGASAFMLSIIEKLWVRVGPLIRSCFNETGFSDSSRHHASIIESLAAGEAGELRQAIVADITVAAQTIRAVQAGRAAARQGAQAGAAKGVRSVPRAHAHGAAWS